VGLEPGLDAAENKVVSLSRNNHLFLGLQARTLIPICLENIGMKKTPAPPRNRDQVITEVFGDQTK
jgi:hypothetical protein